MEIKVKEDLHRKVSVLGELSNIDEFVKAYKQHPYCIGFDVVPANLGIYRVSLVLARKTDTTNLAKLMIDMDYTDVLQRPLIVNAINKALKGKDASPERLEAEMICNTDDYEKIIEKDNLD